MEYRELGTSPFDRMLQVPWNRKGSFVWGLTDDPDPINAFSLTVHHQHAAGTTEQDAMRLAALIQLLPAMVDAIQHCDSALGCLERYEEIKAIREEIQKVTGN